jgi:hypothetical protein
MAAIAAVLSRATGIEIDVDSLRSALIFCAAGLALSLLAQPGSRSLFY